MRAKLVIGWMVLAAVGCSSAGTGTSGTSGGGASGAPCTDLFLEVTGDGLPQRFTITSAKEAAGTLVLGGDADPPGDATITITSDMLGSTKLGQLTYQRGAQQLGGDHAAVTITTLGAVGEAIEGSYAGTVKPVTVGITLSLSGDFKVCRGAGM